MVWNPLIGEGSTKAIGKRCCRLISRVIISRIKVVASGFSGTSCHADSNRFLVNLMVSMVKEGLAHLVLGLKGEGQV